MRLSCSVEVVSQLMPSLNGRPKRRASHSVLTLQADRSSGKKEDKPSVVLMLSTARNVAGTKYKIVGNIRKVFSKFQHEGKATLRFLEPPHDLIISSADPIQLKGFICALALVVKNKNIEHIHFSQPPTKVQKPKTKLVITRRDDYPFASGFPLTLTVLQINDCALQKLSLSVFRLPYLEVLDLGNNSIESLPVEFGQFSNLKELSLANNLLKEFPLHLCSSKLSKSLLALNLDFNKITSLPSEVSNLKQLKVLSVTNNGLLNLPRSIGRLKQLQVLNASHNNIQVLPSSFLQLSLDNLDLHGNPLAATVSSSIPPASEDAPSLLESAARTIVAWRVPYTSEDLLPHLIRYLNTCQWCVCGRPVFTANSRPSIGSVDLLRVAKTVTSVDGFGRRIVPAEVFICRFCLVPNNMNFLYPGGQLLQ